MLRASKVGNPERTNIALGVASIPSHNEYFGACCQGMLGLNNFLPTSGFSTKPLKVKLLAGEQKATQSRLQATQPHELAHLLQQWEGCFRRAPGPSGSETLR